MKSLACLVLAAAAAFAVGCAQSVVPSSPVDSVDPTVGGQGFLLQPTRPTVSLPNSMVRVHPLRKDALDDQIESFPLTMISHRLGELFSIMPTDGTPGRPAYDQEVTTPYYYSTRFDGSMIRTEFTPTERCGFFRFAFPTTKATVLLGNRTEGEIALADKRTVTGTERFNGMRAYVYGEFGADVSASSDAAHRHLTVTSDARTLEFRYGISFISVEQAKRNLREELASRSFDDVKLAARRRWDDTLGQIQVRGGTEAQRRVFYTALYRCYERMVNITEDGQYYSAFDHQVHKDPRPFYVDNWLWDTYRALEPLQALLNPEMEQDKVQSYVRMYEQLGWMPQFAVLWGNHECMTGNPAAVWFADVYAKGLRDFDVAKAYEGVRKNSVEGTWLPWRRGPKCPLDDRFAQLGFMPALHPDEKETEPRVHSWEKRQAISVTLAQSYDDWNTAQLAKSLGKNDDYAFFLSRAANYKNLYRAEKGHVWPKDAGGKWIEEYNPAFAGGMGGRAYTTENNGYTYDWDVQHDLAGLTQLMGGRDKAEAKLDQLFREGLGRSKYEFWATFPDATGLVGQFSMGNEPSFHIPYIYNSLGAPWKTQKRVRMLLDTWFPDTLLGIPGDEDGGGMSAFVVFSMLGFYPVTPGVPTYDLASPVFTKATIKLRDGHTLTINAPNSTKDNKYVRAVTLNGKPLDRVWFTHSAIAHGGTIDLDMSNVPNTELGADPKTWPPSSMDVDPARYSRP